MTSQTTVTGVPNARVPALKRSFERAGATRVEVKDNGDGTSDVTAFFEQTVDHKTFKSRRSA